MNFDDFSKLNRERCEAEDGFNHQLGDWLPSQWTNAMCGEAGEAANYTKKLDRLAHASLFKMNRKEDDKNAEIIIDNIIKELADVIIYVDLTMQRLGKNTMAEVVRVFNEKNKEVGLPDRFNIEVK